MIITVEKRILADAVQQVARFAERRSATLPVLGGILIVAGDAGIKLRATNLETGIDLRIDGSIQEEGVVALPAQTLREITASLGGIGEVKLEHAGDTVVISSSGGRSTLKTLPYEDFPTLSYPEDSSSRFSVPGAVLRNLISIVAPCASPSTVRPELASVLLSVEGGTLKAVATDSFRLCEKQVTVSGNPSPFSILIPAKNALDISQILPDSTIELIIDEHQCAFSFESGVLATRLVTANYPDYAQIIPKSFVSEATLLRKDFDAALKRTAIFSDAFQKIRVNISTSEKRISLSARNADIGESSEDVPASVSGESVELSFNHRYLAAPLSSMTAESITLSASGIGRPLVIRGVGDVSFLYLVMPMNQ